MSGSKAIIALALAISIGVLAVITATLYLDQRAATLQEVAASTAEQPPAPPIPTKSVVVLNKDLKSGASISQDDVTLAEVPLHELPPNHVVNREDLVGRRVAVSMPAGAPVVLDKLIPREQDIEMAGLLIDGMRAYSLNLSATGEVSGFVLPGNRVDVLLSGTSETIGGAFSRTVLQDVKVLAVAQQRFVEDRTVPRPSGLVTLEVTPRQAELLDMARSAGTLSFALRAQTDRSTSVSSGARQEELYGSKSNIEVIRGTDRSLE